MQTYGLQGGSLFGWLTQLQTTFWSEETCGCSPRGLWLNLAVQVSSIRDSVLDKNVPVTVPAEYSEHTDVSSPDSTAELPEHTSINDYPIGLVNNFISHPPALRYRSSTKKIVAFDCVSEVSIIRPSRTGTRCLWSSLYPPGWSVNSDKKFAS